MNILFDFGSIKTGGGVQLAVNFLDYLVSKYENYKINPFYLMPEKGFLSSYLYNDPNILIYPDGYIRRKIFELSILRKFVDFNSIDLFFTFFGSGLPKWGDVKSLVSVAYPIICYPDSEFWRLVPLDSYFKMKLINYFRKSRICNADIVLAETQVMADRLHQYVGISRERLRVVPPVPTGYITETPFRGVGNPKRPVFLFLSGLDFHKNLWRLPKFARCLSSQGLDDFVFKISVSRDDYLLRYGIESDCSLIDKYFDFIGQIPPNLINDIYTQSDFMVNISYLESFSNNYMEAWKASLPIISFETDFSKHICGSSALYISFEDLDASCKKIVDLVSDVSKQEGMVIEGKRRLSLLPSLEQRVCMIFSILKGMLNDS